jgi:cellulose synthase (UDP-forming)
MATLIVAAVYGAIQAEAGNRPQFATILTLFWVVMDIALLGSMVRAARYRGPAQTIQNRLPATVGDEVSAVVEEIDRLGLFEHVAAVTDPDVPARPAPAHLVAVMEAEPQDHRAAVHFDADAALQLRSDIASTLDLPAMVLIDISSVTMVTPSGAAAMLDLLRMVRAHGGELRMFGASKGFTQAHEAMALEAVTRLYSGRDEASIMTRAA